MSEGEMVASEINREIRHEFKTVQTQQSFSPFPEDRMLNVIASGRDFEYATCTNEFEMKRAQESGLIFSNPRPADAELSVIYPSDYEPYRFEELPRLIRTARDLMQAAKIRVMRSFVFENGKVIDIGCGNGALLRLMKRFGCPSWELHANDLNQAALERLAADGFKIHPCSIHELDLGDRFDLAVLNQVIEHFSDVPELLHSIHRILKPGGRVFIETPSTEGWDAKLFQRRYWGGYHFPRHFFLFNEANLSRLLTTHGYNVEKIDYLPSPAFWIQSIHHLLLDRGWKFWASFFTIKNLPLLVLLTGLDMFRIVLGKKTSNMRMIARKAT